MCSLKLHRDEVYGYFSLSWFSLSAQATICLGVLANTLAFKSLIDQQQCGFLMQSRLYKNRHVWKNSAIVYNYSQRALQIHFHWLWFLHSTLVHVSVVKPLRLWPHSPQYTTCLDGNIALTSKDLSHKTQNWSLGSSLWKTTLALKGKYSIVFSHHHHHRYLGLNKICLKSYESELLDALIRKYW